MPWALEVSGVHLFLYDTVLVLSGNVLARCTDKNPNIKPCVFDVVARHLISQLFDARLGSFVQASRGAYGVLCGARWSG